jgi:hypothetical protein
LSRDGLITPTLVGFFSPGCQPCAVELPRFVERARALSSTGGLALAVIDAEAQSEAPDDVERLASVAHVVLQRHRDGELQQAFGVIGYPTVCLVGTGGTVLPDLEATPDVEPVPARSGDRNGDRA